MGLLDPTFVARIDFDVVGLLLPPEEEDEEPDWVEAALDDLERAAEMELEGVWVGEGEVRRERDEEGVRRGEAEAAARVREWDGVSLRLFVGWGAELLWVLDRRRDAVGAHLDALDDLLCAREREGRIEGPVDRVESAVWVEVRVLPEVLLGKKG